MQQESPETDPFMHPPGYSGYTQYGFAQQSGPTNTLAILGFVLAFVVWPAGLVLSILESGRPGSAARVGTAWPWPVW